MKAIYKIQKSIPYLYFIAVAAYWFTAINRTAGITAYPILLFGLPFLWQIIKPNKKLNFTLGITFMCLSSYLIIAHMAHIVNAASFILSSTNMSIFSWLFVLANFVMALWIIKNSIKTPF
jgi:hypothetical protein